MPFRERRIPQADARFHEAWTRAEQELSAVLRRHGRDPVITSAIDVRALRHIVALAKHRNFHRAADVLCITQPALTKSIQNSESLLGVQLFDRHSQEIVPTPYCEIVLDHAVRVFQELEDLQIKLGDLSGVRRGGLRFGCGPQIAPVALADTVTSLIDRHPKIHVEIVIERWNLLTRMLRDGEIQLFVADVEDIRDQPDLLIESLSGFNNIAVCRSGHPLAKDGRVTPRDLLTYPLVLPSLPRRGALWLKENAPDDVPEDDYLSQVIHVTCDSSTLAYRIVQRTDNIALGSEFLFQESIASRTLVKLALRDFTPISQTRPGIVTLRNRTLPRSVEILIEEFRKSYAKLVGR